MIEVDQSDRSAAAANDAPHRTADRRLAQLPSFAEMEFKRGKSLAARGDLRQAQVHFEQASDLVRGQNVEYLVELAQTHEHLDEFDKATDAYSQALSLGPADAVALHFRRGQVAARQGRGDRALEDFSRVVFSLEGDTAAGETCAPQLAAAYHERSRLLRQRGNWTAAFDDLARAVELDPQRADSHFALGQLHEERADHSQSLVAYERALGIIQSFDDARSQRRLFTYHRACALHRLGRLEESIQAYTEVLEAALPRRSLSLVDSLGLTALFERGKAHLDRQMYPKAIDDFTSVLSHDGRHIEAFELRSAAYAAAGEHDQADADIEAALGQRPDFAASYFDRALANMATAPRAALADLNESIRLYERLIARGQAGNLAASQRILAEAYYHRALLRRQSATEIEGAITDLRKSVSLRADHAYARYQLGRTYELVGDHQQAAAQYTQMIVDGFDKFAFVFEARSRCHRELGDTIRATHDLRRARALESRSS